MKLRVAKWEAKDGSELSKNGLIRLNPNKPEFGSLMLISSTITLSGGFANRRNKVGFIVGNAEDLEAMITEYNLREGVDYSQAVAPHRIATLELVESEVPIDKNGTKSGYREKINPTTNEVLTKEGEPIYWKTEVVAEGSDIQDTLIQHDVETEDASVEEFQTAENAESK